MDVLVILPLRKNASKIHLIGKRCFSPVGSEHINKTATKCFGQKLIKAGLDLLAKKKNKLLKF